MKAITAEWHWQSMAFTQIRNFIELTPVTTEAGNNNLFILFSIQPSWTIETIGDQLLEIKQAFGSCSRVIVCSKSYMDELVHRSEEFDYDAYLLTSDSREEFKKALLNVQNGKMYLSKSVITSYCITRRKERESLKYNIKPIL